MSTLERPLAYFKEHQSQFAKEHHGKFVLIHEEFVDGFFEVELEAYTVAKKKYAAGSFLIRPCLSSEEETTQMFHSRVAI